MMKKSALSFYLFLMIVSLAAMEDEKKESQNEIAPVVKSMIDLDQLSAEYKKLRKDFNHQSTHAYDKRLNTAIQLVIKGKKLMSLTEDQPEIKRIQGDLKSIYKALSGERNGGERLRLKEETYGLADDLSDSEEKRDRSEKTLRRKQYKIKAIGVLQHAENQHNNLQKQLKNVESELVIINQKKEQLNNQHKGLLEEMKKNRQMVSELSWIGKMLTCQQQELIDETVKDVTVTQEEIEKKVQENMLLDLSLNGETRSQERQDILQKISTNEEEIRQLKNKLVKLNNEKALFETRRDAEKRSWSDYWRLFGAGES